MTPHGKAIDLSASDWDTGLRYGGLSGLKAKADTTTIQAIGQPGQVVESVRFPAMEGTLTVALSGKGGPVDQVYRRLCAAFSHTLPGTLRIHTPCHGMVSAQVRLAGFITPPKADLDLLGEENVDAVEIPLICDQGVWWTQQVTGVGAYPDYRLKDVIWDEITNSIRAGHGVVANIVAPPSNYPRAV
ncbi:hypothetical protein EU799_04720, partial [Corynebacterium silvaticum]